MIRGNLLPNPNQQYVNDTSIPENEYVEYWIYTAHGYKLRFRKWKIKPLRIEKIAHELEISISDFHHHFKAVTAMSPLQYQKWLQLQEARRLMLGGGRF